jgi:serine protease AprX
MTFLQQITSCGCVHRLGWTLLHSLWQVAIAGALVAILLKVLSRHSASIRYLVACVGLAVMFLPLLATYWLLPASVGPRAADQIAASAPLQGDNRLAISSATPPLMPVRLTDEWSGARSQGRARVDAHPQGQGDAVPLGPEVATASPSPSEFRNRAARLIEPCAPWAVLVWAMGVTALSVWHLGGYLAVRRLRRLGATRTPDSLEHLFQELKARLRVTQPVRLMQSILVEVPVVVGWVRPVVLAPATALAGLTPSEIEAIFAHELAHIRRCDYLANLLQTVAETLLFYHPAVWWISRRIRVERENCCDDAAVLACGSKVDYAEALTRIERRRCAAGLAIAVTGDRRSGVLLGRVRRILGVSVTDRNGASVCLAGIITLALSIALAVVLPYRASDAADNAAGAAENLADAEDRTPAAPPTEGHVVQALVAKAEGSFTPGESRIQGNMKVSAKTRSARVPSLFLHPHIENTRLCVNLQFTSQEAWGARFDVTLWDDAGNVVAKCSHTEEVGPEKLYFEQIPPGLVQRWNAFRAIWLDLPKKAETARRFRVELQELREPPPRDAQRWGEPVEGVSARLRPVKDRWKAGEVPEFLADVRNLGNLDLLVTQVQQVCELDGREYRRSGEADVKDMAFGPGRERHDIPIRLSDSWRRVKDPAALTLAPGWHLLRVTFTADRRDRNSGGAVRFQSNVVGFRMEPASPRAAASQNIPKGDLSLTAQLVDANGKPLDSCNVFWRSVAPASAEATPNERTSVFGVDPSIWRDKASEKTWKPFQSGGTEVTELAPGDYRVTATTGAWPTPLGVSDVVHLDGAHKHTVLTIKLETGPSLTVAAADVVTGKPVGWYQVMLMRDDGLPLGGPVWATEKGRFTFHQLPRGIYWLSAGYRARQFGETEYVASNGPLQIKVVGDTDMTVSVPMKPVALAEEEINRRWPFSVTGKVTDDQGQPLQGVEVHASCGWGTLMPTGSTRTGPDGTYRLLFGPGRIGGRATAANPLGVGVQAATIRQGMPGYFEKNLGRQGNLIMTDSSGPLPESSRYAGVVKPREPYRLDFVMSYGVAVRGTLVDEAGKPIVRQNIWITAPKLPPSCSVLSEVTTDEHGHFQFGAAAGDVFEFGSVPMGPTWQLGLRRGGTGPDVCTPGFSLADAGSYDIKVVLGAKELRIVSLARRAATTASVANPAARIYSAGNPPGNMDRIRDLIAQGKWDEVKKLAPMAVRARNGANMADGTLTTGKPILLDWDVCVPKGAEAVRGDEQRPLIYRYPWVEFTQIAGGLNAAIHLQYESWPHCSWMLRVEVLDQAGRRVSDAWAAHENSGMIEKYPGVEEQTVALHLGPKAAKEGKTFRCSLESVWVEQGGRFQFGQQAPLSLDLSSVEVSKVFRAQWLKLDKLDGDVRATVHVRMLSWPKSGWRLNLKLFDEKGQQAGHATATMENAGAISSYPAIRETDVRFNVKGASDLMQSARSCTLRIERTAATIDGSDSIAPNDPEAKVPPTQTPPAIAPPASAQMQSQQAPPALDPVGSWRSVDFVRKVEEFQPGSTKWRGDLVLKQYQFFRNGRTSSGETWKGDWITHPNGQTRAQYFIKTVGGESYLFLPWLNGDVTVRGEKPAYYVLKRKDPKETEESGGKPKPAGTQQPSFQMVRPVASVEEFDDVRWKDLSGLDLSDHRSLPATLTFNEKTVWPESSRMPAGCRPREIMTAAMNPGLGVGAFHKEGITGKGVNVAIIDQPLYQDNPEFVGKIAAYHDVGCESERSSMHGPAVASLLVGEKCGTAPGARVYYAAVPSWKRDAGCYAKALDWIVEQNGRLSASEKIRVVSVSAAPSGPGSPFNKNNAMWDEACARAEAMGILVLDCTQHHGFIGPCWYRAEAREDAARCVPGFPGKPAHGFGAERILVPSSPRTTVEEYTKGEFSYQYYGRGGLSWSIPYCAGVLAMGWQLRPDLTASQMRGVLLLSASVTSEDARIIDPKQFISKVRSSRKGYPN